MYVLVTYLLLALWSVVANAGVTVTASAYQEPNKPSNAFDGSWETRWSCQGECWLEMDFGREIVFNGLDIAWWVTEDDRVLFFDIEVSTDGETWEMVYEGDNNGVNDGAALIFAPTPMPIRYVRYLGHGNDYNNWNSIREIHPYNSITAETKFYWNLIFVEAVTASDQFSTFSPEYAADFEFDTHWTGNAPAWLVLDLGEVASVASIHIAWYHGKSRVYDFNIEVSEDGQNWQQAFAGKNSKTNDGNDHPLETYPLNDEYMARYVRLNCSGNNHKKFSKWCSINEIEVWGFADFDLIDLGQSGDLVGSSR